ncbi:hypothetical protein BDN72DRAFT_832214 [Pluteus cervinus]|uniref:Uncharacterized protein n=1 Tax=Pluteus cervinus TaxID=181527 RepID=A0ACD3BEA7_9AGAR|nr:hypothetical protein BDN72DRAFT_832214 [Pluteus cervinus]
MPPKAHRNTGPGALRAHSRSSSSTRLGTNLQFTQKDGVKVAQDKGKKNGFNHDVVHKIQRVNSAQRIPSQPQIQAPAAAVAGPTATTKKAHTPSATSNNNKPSKSKAGFTIAKADDEEDDDDDEVDDDDDDAWISTESGAATPNHNDDSDSESTNSDSVVQGHNGQHQVGFGGKTPVDKKALTDRLEAAAAASTHDTIPPVNDQPSNHHQQPRAESTLTRVPTARLSDYQAPVVAGNVTPPAAAYVPLPAAEIRVPFHPPSIQQQPLPRVPSLPYIQNLHIPDNQEQWPKQPRSAHPSTAHQNGHAVYPIRSSISTGGPASKSSAMNGTSHKRAPRPASMHSISGRSDHSSLRPHPLIRGQSNGPTLQPPRPIPLAPLTVIADEPSTDEPLSTSPTSMRTNTTSPTSPEGPSSSYTQHRRTSVSSTRSVSTLPIHAHHPYGSGVIAHDRHRTLSTISASSSSAALSSLVHLPTVTRPPSPQARSYFPPMKPNANIEGIHPLLPVPYLNNHLTVLARRTPIRESFDRVVKAKYAVGGGGGGISASGFGKVM